MIKITSSVSSLNGKVFLEASKSISNRILLIKALSNQDFKIENLSNADDTVLMSDLIKNYQNRTEIDCHHAGTTLRFLTAFLSIKKGEWIVKGSERMHLRPIGPLIDSLTKLGANITYINKANHPPLRITGTNLSGDDIEIKGDISSQYISALLMIAPTLNNGLKLKITSKILSRPYIQMTLSLMHQMGIHYSWKGSRIEIKNQIYNCNNFTVENDWSAASFWYSFAALSENSKIEIPLLFNSSIQGDSFLSKIYLKFGVNTSFTENGITIQKLNPSESKIKLDLTDYPDLALSIAITCAGLGVNTFLYGLESLKHKESDRLLMIKNELEKFNIKSEIDSSSIKIKEGQILTSPTQVIETHNDHRIPMSIAPLCLKVETIKFDSKNVVNKSYPKFWDDLELLGINCVEDHTLLQH